MRACITSYLLSIWLEVALVALLPALGGCVQEKADNADAAANSIVGAEHVTRMLLQQGGGVAESTSSGIAVRTNRAAAKVNFPFMALVT